MALRGEGPRCSHARTHACAGLHPAGCNIPAADYLSADDEEQPCAASARNIHAPD